MGRGSDWLPHCLCCVLTKPPQVFIPAVLSKVSGHHALVSAPDQGPPPLSSPLSSLPLFSPALFSLVSSLLSRDR